MATEDGLGVQTLLRTNMSPTFPLSFTEAPGGLLLMANGVDPMMKWDGMAESADTVGIVPPSIAMELGGAGLGTITGNLVAYSRFVDALGNVSDLSPISNLVYCGLDGFVEDCNWSVATGIITIISTAHGLVTGDAVMISMSDSLPQINGNFYVTVVDNDTFTITGVSIASGIYTGGAIWTMGIQTILYGAVPVPTEAKVVRRQILRNLAGSLDTLYVDVDTDDLVTTAFASQATDPILAASEPVPLFYNTETPETELPYANRHGVPPSHKSVLCTHKGRIYAAVDATYSDGHVEIAFNSTNVQGVGTAWQSTFVGRLLYVVGASQPYFISDVDELNQIITLDSPFYETPFPFYSYVIQPDPGERRLIYYSEPGLPESWPAYNALAIPETDDDIVSIESRGQYLYIIEKRHIHRLSNQGDPQDGIVFLVAHRGSISNRTYAEADGLFYMLDEIGIHKFDEEKSESISMPIQNLFQNDGTSDIRIDWTADQTLWHACTDAVRDTVRWFVQMVGYVDLYHAICYNYRTDRWWIEQYPTAMISSTETTFGARRCLTGTDARRVVCLGEGAYDGVVSDASTLRGTVTAADSISLTDSSASFGAVEGVSLAIVNGVALGQIGIIASSTATTLEVVQPWTVTPNPGDTYQIGGIPWMWRSGWFRFLDSEEEIPRDIEVVFLPTDGPATINMELYFDHSPTPRTWDRTIAQDGVSTTEGLSFIVVDLDAVNAIGWARQRLGGHANTYSFGDRFVSLNLSGVQSGDPVRISQVVVTGVED